jgi:hypothetical protein
MEGREEERKKTQVELFVTYWDTFEDCIIRHFHHCTNIRECAYTNQDGLARVIQPIVPLTIGLNRNCKAIIVVYLDMAKVE